LCETEKGVAVGNSFFTGERAFYEAGKALMKLQSRKLYRNIHKTFEEYCKDRFEFERRHPYRLIEAIRFVENLIKMCPNWTQ
jgi:hypothetical protein